MKINICLLFAAIIVISACQKHVVNIQSSITGKWDLRAVYSSAGGPLIKQTGTDTTQYVQFNTDGTLLGNAYPGVNGYFLIDSAHVSLIKADNNAQVYSYNVAHDTLTMGNTSCIEGCPMKFVKSSY